MILLNASLNGKAGVRRRIFSLLFAQVDATGDTGHKQCGGGSEWGESAC